ncbi:trichohyalin-like, partial [Clinocottus analis]|uniref:trichohyalin-like n=1 Tax=Clinocottus analis TaxID=304258 RepID=UPI0035C0E87F
MTETEHKWTMENSKQIEDKQTQAIMKTKREIITRQRQLTCQVLVELEKLLEETQSQRDEIDYMKTNAEIQQEDIDRLTAEKHELHLLIKRLRLQIENVIEELVENKNEAFQEKMQLLKMQTEIYQERETLERRRNELINERHKLEMIKYDQTKSKENERPMEQIKREQEITEKIMADSLLSLIKENTKRMLEEMQVKEQITESMADIKQEIKINKKSISQHQDQIYHIKHNMNVNINKMKQGWTKMQSWERQKEEKDTSKTVNFDFSGIQEEMGKLWEMLEEGELQLKVTVREVQELKTESGRGEHIKSDYQKQRECMKTTHWETDMQEQNLNLEKTLALVQSEEDAEQNIRTQILTDSENIENYRQVAQAENNTMKSEQGSSQIQTHGLDDNLQRTKKEIREMEDTEAAKEDIAGRQAKTKKHRSEHSEDGFDEQKIIIQQVDRTTDIIQHKENQFEKDNIDPSMLYRVRGDTEQSRRDFTEEKSQIQWSNFRVKKKRRELDQRLERTMRERDEVEIMKVKIQQQGKEMEEKLEDTMTTMRTMSEMKACMEKAAAELNLTREDMLKVQRKMDQNKEEVKKNLDKMTSMKAQVSEWILTEPAIKNTFSGNTSKHQEPQKETDPVKEQTFETPTDKEDAEDEMTKDTMSLQQSISLEEWHRSEEVKEQEDIHSEHKQRQEFQFPAVDMKEEYNVLLQMQTIIHEETSIDDDQTKCAKEMEEIKKQMSKLKEEQEQIGEQIKCATENMEQNNQEIERLIMGINVLQSQKPKLEDGLQIRVRESTNVFKHKLVEYKLMVHKQEKCSKLNQEVIDVQKQKQGQESSENIQTHTVDIDKKDSTDLQKLRGEIYRTKEIIRLVNLELEDPAEVSYINKLDEEEESGVDGLIHEMKLFQELLKLVKAAIRKREVYLKDETSNMKLTKTAAKKQKMKLDQRLEKTLRERDELDILKIKLQRQTDVTEKKFEKMAKVMSTIEKIAAKTKLKNEDMKIVMKETELQLRQMEDLNYKIETTKQELENRLPLISQERARLIKVNSEICQNKSREHTFESTEKEERYIKKYDRAKTDTESDNMTNNRMGKEKEKGIFQLRSEKDTLGKDILLTEHSLDQKNGEIEPLNKSICEEVIEKKNIEMLNQHNQTEWENVSKERKAETEIHKMNCLRESMERQKQELDDKVQMTKREIREMELLKSELEMKKRESKHIFRKSMKLKEESEIKWNDIQREKKVLRRETTKRRRELEQKLEVTMREMDKSEILRIKLHQQKEALDEEKQRFKEQTTLIQVSTEDDEKSLEKHPLKEIRAEVKMIQQISKDTNSIIDIPGLEIRLEEVKRERREMEVLKSELEIEKRENQQMIRKGIQKEQEGKKMWAQVKVEKDALKRETKRRKKELEQRLERINRERDELEIMKLKMQREKDGSKGGMKEWFIQFQNLVQKHWELIQTCMEKYKVMKKQSEDVNEYFKGQKRHMEAQAKNITQGREEVENIKMDIQRQKNIMNLALKNMQQMQTHLGNEKFDVIKVNINQSIKREKERIKEKSEDLLVRGKEFGDEQELLKNKVSMLTHEQQKEKKEHNEMKRRINDAASEKEMKVPRTKRKLMQKKGDVEKVIMQDVQSGKGHNDEEVLIDEKTPSKGSEDILLLQLNKPSEDSIKKKADILRTKIKLHVKREIRKRKNNLNDKDIKINTQELEDSQRDKTQREKRNIIEETLQLQTERDLKQKEQELKEDEFKRQTQELETGKNSVLADREELDIWRKDLNREKEEVEAAMNIISKEREQLSQMKISTEMDRHRENMAYYTELIEREKESLRSILSDLVIQKKDLENQWRQKIELDKQDGNKLKAEQKQDGDDLDREVEMMNKDKLDLELMRSELQKQRDILEQEKQDMQRQSSELEITMTELQKK